MSRQSPKMESPQASLDPPKQKTVSRVPRACNACRRQKMKCDTGEDGALGPCKRCRHANIECLFEKPQRESALSSDAGIERIRAVEDRVRGVEDKMIGVVNGLQGIQATLHEVLAAFRQGLPHGSPVHNGSVASPEARRVSAHSPVDARGRQPPGPSYPHVSHQPESHPTPSSAGSYENQFSPTTVAQPHGPYPPNVQGPSASTQPPPTFHPAFPSLPPISPAGANVMPPPKFPTSLPPIRSQLIDPYQSNVRGSQLPGYPNRPGSARANNSSNVTSADSSDDDGASELPGAGLVAPLEVLRGLGEEHELRASNQENPVRRPRSPSIEAPDGSRPKKRRRTSDLGQKAKYNFPDVVTKGLVTVEEARDLFNIFYKGCSTFLPVFDSNFDTFESLHERSPFAVNAICMVASQVRDGGGPTSQMTQMCRDEVHNIAAQTLFAPVSSPDAVRAVVILSGWSPNGWLTCGHAVRMAFQLEMNKAWPRLLRRINNNKTSTTPAERELVVAARTWFCLYLFEHQMSFGTGRPAILKEDDSVLGGSALLGHPLSIEDDARLVSTVELMIFRERANDALAPLDRPFTEDRFITLTEATENFRKWYGTWDTIFSQRYPDTTFYRQSLQIQYLFAELYHEATALRGITGPEDISRMPDHQRQIAERAIRSAQQGLEICLRSQSYREGLTYAVTYTHLTAVFAASFLMRLARLFPDECERAGGVNSVFETVEELANLLSTIPATRYARTLRLMLTHRKRRYLPPNVARPSGTTNRSSSDTPTQHVIVSPQSQHHVEYMEEGYTQGHAMQPPPHHRMMSQESNYSHQGAPVYVGQGTPRQFAPILNGMHGTMPPHMHDSVTPTDYQMFNFPPDQIPLYMSEDNLGDAGYGLEAFIVPQTYDAQIW